MDPDAVDGETPGQTVAQDDPVSRPGLLEDARSLWHELRGLTHDHFRLAALETQLAGESLVAMIVAGVMVAVLLNVAWLGLVAAAVLALAENGVEMSSAILLAVASNLLGALILCGVIRRKSRCLGFPATLRRLQPMPPEGRDSGKS